MAVGVALVLPGTPRAADPRFPDWPCVQLKVPEISIAAVWSGPPIDDVRDTWQNDPQIRDLVDRLAARRTPNQSLDADQVADVQEPHRRQSFRRQVVAVAKDLDLP